MSPVVLDTRMPVARKAHVCDLCRRVIRTGERYEAQSNVADGSAYTWKSCAHCAVYSAVLWADDRDYLDDGLDWTVAMDYEPGALWKLRLKAQYMRQWTRKDGALMPVPRLIRCRVFCPRTSWTGDVYTIQTSRILGVTYAPAVTR